MNATIFTRENGAPFQEFLPKIKTMRFSCFLRFTTACLRPDDPQK
jgi:hypothetical protein